MPIALEKEYKFFTSHLDELIKTNKNDFVVIKGEEVVGFFNSYEKALRAGLTRFGATTPFFIEEVKKEVAIHCYHGTR